VLTKRRLALLSNAGTQFSKGMMVLAMFPNTTAFYPATVQVGPRRVTPHALLSQRLTACLLLADELKERGGGNRGRTRTTCSCLTMTKRTARSASATSRLASSSTTTSDTPVSEPHEDRNHKGGGPNPSANALASSSALCLLHVLPSFLLEGWGVNRISSIFERARNMRGSSSLRFAPLLHGDQVHEGVDRSQIGSTSSLSACGLDCCRCSSSSSVSKSWWLSPCGASACAPPGVVQV
jgi:hypothetical protein